MSSSGVITVIYKPTNPELAFFLSEFIEVVTGLISSPTCHPIIIGDFNYYVNTTSNQYYVH